MLLLSHPRRRPGHVSDPLLSLTSVFMVTGSLLCPPSHPHTGVQSQQLGDPCDTTPSVPPAGQGKRQQQSLRARARWEPGSPA